ncbi:hypothetical protein [Xylophilus sp. GOD-11R]|uniref:hypothetical protein n=1 Tax=Xylophilus sp. GOD-11R TaxID=3089814 RepID=UPI00298D21D8|nr:hypothetical protein [Xylophilus sp. GOD-11R]WPB56197.1 hypothetical protein R9X41_18930 [Xylophilus sp. GOD-11R]
MTNPLNLKIHSSATAPLRFGAGLALFGATAVLAMASATAQVATSYTGADGSGSFASERASCASGNTQQAQATCMEEARNAAADKRRGQLAEPHADYAANKMRRCDVFQPGTEDRAACVARVQGDGQASGNVASGGVVREVETIVLPASGRVRIEPRTADPVLLVPVKGSSY